MNNIGSHIRATLNAAGRDRDEWRIVSNSGIVINMQIQVRSGQFLPNLQWRNPSYSPPPVALDAVAILNQVNCLIFR
jgi:hypothetical protein